MPAAVTNTAVLIPSPVATRVFLACYSA